MTTREAIQTTTGAVRDVLRVLCRGPVWDGGLPSKTGRNALVMMGLADQWNGWNFLTRDGVEAAHRLGFLRE
jgi:hypothetical protein